MSVKTEADRRWSHSPTRSLELAADGRVERQIGEIPCPTISPTKVRRTEAASVSWSRTKFSTGPINSAYRRSGSPKPCGTSVTPPAADGWLVRLQTINTSSKDICRDTAKLLSQGHVFAWFQGRSEFGPRALGNRSILADPRQDGMKNKLNKRVKHRQAFRPFAPVVLAERANEIFEGDEESPFMLLVKRVRPEWKDKIPAIVHVDGTARVQTIRQDQNERLYRLLQEFDAITGVPVLLNTSLNVKGEPIVETPADAVACFLGTGIDYLALHDMLIAKSALHRIFAPFRSAYSEMSSVVQRGLAVEIRD